jgi:hypothetical protein
MRASVGAGRVRASTPRNTSWGVIYQITWFLHTLGDARLFTHI